MPSMLLHIIETWLETESSSRLPTGRRLPSDSRHILNFSGDVNSTASGVLIDTIRGFHSIFWWLVCLLLGVQVLAYVFTVQYNSIMFKIQYLHSISSSFVDMPTILIMLMRRLSQLVIRFSPRGCIHMLMFYEYVCSETWITYQDIYCKNVVYCTVLCKYMDYMNI